MPTFILPFLCAAEIGQRHQIIYLSFELSGADCLLIRGQVTDRCVLGKKLRIKLVCGLSGNLAFGDQFLNQFFSSGYQSGDDLAGLGPEKTFQIQGVLAGVAGDKKEWRIVGRVEMITRMRPTIGSDLLRQDLDTIDACLTTAILKSKVEGPSESPALIFFIDLQQTRLGHQLGSICAFWPAPTLKLTDHSAIGPYLTLDHDLTVPYQLGMTYHRFHPGSLMEIRTEAGKIIGINMLTRSARTDTHGSIICHPGSGRH